MLVEHLGEFLAVLNPHTSKQLKSNQYLPQHRNGVLEKFDDKNGLSITRPLDSETAIAALGLLLGHIAQ